MVLLGVFVGDMPFIEGLSKNGNMVNGSRY